MSGFQKRADSFTFEGNSAGPKGKASSSGSAASDRREGVDRMIDQLRDLGRSLRMAEAVPPELMSLYRQVSRTAYSFRGEEGMFLAAAIGAEPVLRAILNVEGSTAAAAEATTSGTSPAVLPIAGEAVLPQAVFQTIASGIAPIAPLAGLNPALAEMRDMLLSSASHLARMASPEREGSVTDPATPASGGDGARSITPATSAPAEPADIPSRTDAGGGTTPPAPSGGDPLPGPRELPDVMLPSRDAVITGTLLTPDPAPETAVVTTPDITPAPVTAEPTAPDITPAPPATNPATPAVPDPQARMTARISLDEGHSPSGGGHLDSISQRVLTVTDGTLQQVRLSLSADGVPSGLKALDGSDILLHAVSGQVVEGRLSDGTVVFTLGCADDGRLTIDLDAPVQHGTPGSGTDALLTLARDVLTLKADFRGTDGTLHHRSFDLGPVIEIRDGTPGHQTNATGPELRAGADGGEIRLLDTGAPSGFTYRLDGNGDLTILQQQGGQDVAVRTLSLVAGQWQVTTLAPVHFAGSQGLQDIDLSIRYSLTDGDGDRVEDVFSLHFTDSQPDITLRTITLAERFGTQTVQSAVAFTANDGIAGVEWDAAMTVPAGFRTSRDAGDPTGATLLVEQSQNGNWMTVMTLVLDAATGTVGATQNARLLEDGSNGGLSSFRFDFTVTDRDGDATAGHVDIDVTRLGVTFRTVDFHVTETGTTGQMDDAAFSWTRGLQSGEWLATGAPAGFTYVLDAADAANRTLLVQQNGQTVAKLVLDLATGHVSLDHAGNLLHATGNGLNDQTFTLTYRLHDASGTFADSSVNLSFRDSIPVITPVTENIVDSTAQTIGGALFSAMDGIASARWNTANAPAGFTYVLDPLDASGRKLLVQQGGVTRLVATLDTATGRYSVTQISAISHGGQNSLGFDLSFNATDRDGDTATGTVRIEVEDTAPLVQSTPRTITEAVTAQTVELVQLTSTDGVASITWTGLTAAAGFTTTIVGNDLLISQMQGGSSVRVMTLTYSSATGKVTATLNAPINHVTDGAAETFFAGFTVTDRDGSATQAGISLTVQDTQPLAPVLNLAAARMTEGLTYNGTWTRQQTGDRIIALDITLDGQTRTLDLTNPNAVVDFTVNGIRVIYRSNGTFTLTSNVTQNRTMDLQVGARDMDGDVTWTTLTRQIDFVNLAPTGTSSTIFLTGRNNYTLQLANFGFGDRDGNTLDHVTLTTAPSNGGKFLLNGVQIAAGADVSLQDILDGKLVLQMPATATLGSSFVASFTVTDNGGTANGGVNTSMDFDLNFTISNTTRLTGTAGDDVFNGDIPADNYNGGAGNDTIRGGGGSDILAGGDGGDTIYGDDGVDTINGNADNDTLYGGPGNDAIYGDAGDDRIYGDDGNDYAYGGDGDDIIYGGLGSDFLRGNDGDDILYGEAGINTYTGGLGADTFVIDPAQLGTTNDWVMDFNLSEGDVIDLSLILDYLPVTVTDLETARYCYTTMSLSNRIIRLKTSTGSDCAVVTFPVAFAYTDEQIKVKFKDIQGNYHYDLI